MADVTRAVQRFVECQKGRTTHLSTWSGSGFDEAAFEARVTPARMPLGFIACRTLKLASRYLAGEYDEALAASADAAPHLAAGAAHMVVPEWHYYSALADAARRTVNPAEPERLERIASHAAELERWAERCPENFHHKQLLVLAEASRLSGRELEAMRLYDQAIASARDNGFVHCEAIAAETAVRFYLERDFSTIAATYLRLARSAYARWGADGKVLQLDRRHAKLAFGEEGLVPSLGVAMPGEPIDAITAVRTAQAVSEEIVLQRLLVTLMRIVVEHGGAQRCHVLLLQSGELSHAGQAFMDAQGLRVEVSGASCPVLGAIMPESIIGYVRRTREPILLEDATAQPMFSADPYVARERPRSVLCMPIVRQADLVGIFYMENSLVPGAFTSRRLALLEFLATQAAISLEHARLYADLTRENAERRRTEGTLRKSEARLRRLVETANVIPWEADAETERFIYVGPQAEERLGWPASAWYKGNFIRDHVHPDDRELAIAGFVRACADGNLSDLEYRILARDGRAVWLHMVVSVAEREGGERLLSGFFFDVTERKEAEETLRKKIAIIAQQQEDIRALSTPILGVPLGTKRLERRTVQTGRRSRGWAGLSSSPRMPRPPPRFPSPGT
jgi:PAS domain S-box-containing protein